MTIVVLTLQEDDIVQQDVDSKDGRTFYNWYVPLFFTPLAVTAFGTIV